MPLILAIESDKRQASRITAIARSLNRTELVIAESVEQALSTLGARVPDLILTPPLLSPKDSTALDDRLRELDAAGQQVQTLMTPMLASASPARKPTPKTGLLMRLRKTQRPSSPDGCEPSVFAAQITEYLDRACEQRAFDVAHDSTREDQLDERPAEVGRHQETVADAPGPETIDALATFTADVTAQASEPEPPQQPQIEMDAEAVIDPAALFAQRLADVSQHVDRPDEFRPVATETFDEPIVTSWSAMPWPDAPVPIPTDDPALAAEVAAILSTPSPSMTAGAEWVDVDMDLLAAHPAPAPAAETVLAAAPVAASEEGREEALRTPPAADDFDVSEFVRALEAGLAADVPTKRQRRKRAAIARKPVPERDLHEDEPEPSFDDYDPNADLWMPLPAVARALWPQLGDALCVVKPAAAMRESAGGSPGVGSSGAREATRKPGPAPVNKVEPDEWGLFDPQQCGLAALLDRLDEITDTPSE